MIDNLIINIREEYICWKKCSNLITPKTYNSIEVTKFNRTNKNLSRLTFK